MKTVRSQKLTTKLKLGNVFILACLLAFSSSSGMPVQAQVLLTNTKPQILDGDLDMTFGTNGTVTTDFTNSIDYGWSIALQPDGKIIMAGASINNNGTDFVLARYNKNGSLDTTFDTDGKVVTDFGSEEDGGYDVAIQPDGKIVLAGSIFTEHGDNFALARYNRDGSLDTTFDSDGKVITAIGNFADRGYGVAIQSDGKIVMAGVTLSIGSQDFALVRYNSNGSLDTGFGVDGKVITDLGNNDRGNALIIQPLDGKIIVVGDSYDANNLYFALARYNTDGSLDTTFDNDGKVITTIGGWDFAIDVALQPDGKIVAAGGGDNISAYRDFVLMRYNSNGSLDTTFDTDGKVITDFGRTDDGHAVVIQPDGKIVMVGAGNVLSTFALARYNSDGTLDNNFGTDGKVITGIGSSSVAYAVALQPDGNIIVAGSSYNGSDLDFVLARYMGDSPPTVVSISRANLNPTNAINVNFTIIFSEPVQGVDIVGPTFDDFALTTSPGITGASVTGVSGSGTTYTVTVNTGIGNGTIRLDVIDHDTILDGAGNPLGGTGVNNGNFTTGEVYTINKTTSGGDTIGTFRPSNATFYLRNSNSAGAPNITVKLGKTGDYPVVGDWDGNGTDTIGVYRNGVFYLSNSNTTGHVDLTFAFGKAGDQPIAGDWNGDGIDTIGIYRSSKITFLLRNTNSAGAADATFKLGTIGDVGIAGDWNADGMDTTGVFRPKNGALYLKNANTTGYADIVTVYGIKNDKPVVGDWDSDGDATIGIYRSAQFYLRNTNTIGYADFKFAFGATTDMPVAGNWDGIP